MDNNNNNNNSVCLSHSVQRKRDKDRFYYQCPITSCHFGVIISLYSNFSNLVLDAME